jgi:hypothetical protein
MPWEIVLAVVLAIGIALVILELVKKINARRSDKK